MNAHAMVQRQTHEHTLLLLCFFTLPLAPACSNTAPKNASMSAVLPSRDDPGSVIETSTSITTPSASTGSRDFSMDLCRFLRLGFMRASSRSSSPDSLSSKVKTSSGGMRLLDGRGTDSEGGEGAECGREVDSECGRCADGADTVDVDVRLAASAARNALIAFVWDGRAAFSEC